MTIFGQLGLQGKSLKTPPDWRDEITLVPWSGIQILDFGFDLGDPGFRRRFIERSVSGPDAGGMVERQLIALSGDAEKDAPVHAGARPDDEEYGVDAAKAVEPYLGAWIPVPVLCIRREQGAGSEELYDRGPSTWARVRLVALEERDAETGHTHRMQLAFDTALAAAGEDATYARPRVADASNPRRFRLVAEAEKMAWFLRDQEAIAATGADPQAWVTEWLHELWVAHLTQKRGRPPKLDEMDRKLEHWARYLAFLALVSSATKIPTIRLCDTVSGQDAVRPVEVDLVLDIGNSRSCGVMIERFPDETGVDLSRSYPLELRDLGEPERAYCGLFDSAMEFSEVCFGNERFAAMSGNRGAFLWPGFVRIGPEARRLMQGDDGSETIAGQSSAKRYLWDDRAREQEWRVHRVTAGEALPRNIRAAMQHLNESGDVLNQVRSEEQRRLRKAGRSSMSRAIRPKFSRSACFGLMLSEILAHAFVQVNDPGARQRRRQAELPRRLSRIILTLPTATTAQEQAIIRSRAEGALDLIWSILEIPAGASSTAAPPQLHVDWDEASCTQLVWLYNETQRIFGGRIRGAFDLMAGRRSGDGETASMRVGSLDIGGGTTDLVLTEYRCDDDRVLMPAQVFREGFRVAGDDVVRAICNDVILPALCRQIAAAGGRGIDAVLTERFGSDVGGRDQRTVQLRRQVVQRVLVPLAHALLAQMEGDVLPATLRLDSGAGGVPALGDLPEHLRAFIEGPARACGAAEWRLGGFRAEIAAADVDRVIRNHLKPGLDAMLGVLDHLGVDVLLLTGRPSRLSTVRSMVREALILPPQRIVDMDRYEIDGWYPFRDIVTRRIGDPKSTVAVGAMLMCLAESRLPNFRVDPAAYRLRSTARFIGEMEQSGQITDARLLFSDVDLDAFRGGETAVVTMQAPVFIGFRQLPLERWPGSPLYRLDFANAGAANLRLPLRVTIERAEAVDEDEGMTAEMKLRAERAREAFAVSDVEDAEGGGRAGDVVLRLHTLGFEEDYWLDTGVLRPGR